MITFNLKRHVDEYLSNHQLGYSQLQLKWRRQCSTYINITINTPSVQARSSQSSQVQIKGDANKTGQPLYSCQLELSKNMQIYCDGCDSYYLNMQVKTDATLCQRQRNII